MVCSLITTNEVLHFPKLVEIFQFQMSTILYWLHRLKRFLNNIFLTFYNKKALLVGLKKII